jgi:AraC-like DNA-binding protein
VFFAESVHGAEFEMRWRRDPFHKCIYVLRGVTVHVDRASAQQTILRAGTVVLIPAGLEHRLADQEPCIVLLLCLGTEFVKAEAELAELWQRLLQVQSGSIALGPWWRRRIENLFRHAVVEQTMAQPGWGIAVKAAAAQILVQLARVRSERRGGDADHRVAFVAREMEESLFDEWDLDRAAARAEMSRRAFSARFRAQTGQTFLERITELRLKHAAQLLQQGNHSIVGAAFASGYHDLSHFYRLFRGRFQMTPKAWVQRNRPSRSSPDAP